MHLSNMIVASRHATATLISAVASTLRPFGLDARSQREVATAIATSRAGVRERFVSSYHAEPLAQTDPPLLVRECRVLVAVSVAHTQ